MEIVTTRWVSEVLQTSADTVELLIKRGEIKAERLSPRGRYRISKESVMDYADRRGIVLKSSQPQPQ